MNLKLQGLSQLHYVWTYLNVIIYTSIFKYLFYNCDKNTGCVVKCSVGDS